MFYVLGWGPFARAATSVSCSSADRERLGEGTALWVCKAPALLSFACAVALHTPNNGLVRRKSWRLCTVGSFVAET